MINIQRFTIGPARQKVLSSSLQKPRSKRRLTPNPTRHSKKVHKIVTRQEKQKPGKPKSKNARSRTTAKSTSQGKKRNQNQFVIKPSVSEYAFELLPHQRTVVQYMLDHRGVLVYHLPGSGKTRIPIVLAALLKIPTIVVVPASLVDNFWKEWKQINRIHRVSRKLFQVMSSHAFLENTPDCTSKLLIVDEAHELRNPEGKISKKILEEAAKADKVLLLTGTPCVNGPQDMAPLLNMIVKQHMELTIKQGIFSRDVKIFRDIPTGEKFIESFGEDGLNSEGRKVWSELFPCVFSYYLPPLSDDYPTMKIEEIMVPMASEQLKIYSAWEARNLTPEMVKMLSKPGKELLSSEKRSRSKNSVERKSMPSSSSLKAKAKSPLPSKTSKPSKPTQPPKFQAYLDGGRRICNVVNVGDRIIAPKFDAMIQHIENNPGQAVVFSQYLSKGIDIAEKLLQERNISYAKFTGRESAQQKANAVKAYNSKKVRVFLISTAGSLGLDLKNTDTMHIMDPAWNLAKINQAIYRVRRYKSHALPNAHVTIYKYFCYKPKSIFQSSSKVTPSADVYLLEVSKRKEAAIQKFLEFAVQHAIEKKPGMCQVKFNRMLVT